MLNKISYSKLIHESMYYVMIQALKYMEKSGIENYNLYITFLTSHKGVKISNSLRNKYKNKMTILLQQDLCKLKVSNRHFEVSLTFNNIKESIIIPYKAILSFVDPLETFELEFDIELDNMIKNYSADNKDKSITIDNIINLEKYRNKLSHD